MPHGETLQGGPAGPAFVDRVGPGTWRRVVLAVVFAFGAMAGAGALALFGDPRDERQEPSAPAPSSSVQLVITGVADHSRAEEVRGGAEDEALWLDGVLAYVQGRGAVTVTRVHRPGRGLIVLAPALPLRLTPGSTFERIQLSVSPRECRLASMWTPSARPFTLTWRADDGSWHSNPAGDHNASMELTWLAHMDSVCDERPDG
jgi:hypothetical protein